MQPHRVLDDRDALDPERRIGIVGRRRERIRDRGTFDGVAAAGGDENERACRRDPEGSPHGGRSYLPSTNLVRPWLAVSRAIFWAFFSRNPGNGILGSTVSANFTSVPSPFGVSV